ncbi:MAG TPA: SBBP repeat-containing protein, partial [Bryobacteraceae bacterium]|nr:SBBP repeat-containing protein [Bryobacteraceae bacterium]
MRSILLFAILISTGHAADFTTYIGDQNQYQVSAIATDAAGDTYVTGSRTILIPGNPLSDVFVTKLDPAGNIVFTTTFGGKGSDQGNAIALDAAGNIWVGGVTDSGNFPLLDALPVAATGGGFLVRLAPDGIVAYSSYFYGAVNGVAIDAGGNVYVTGTTVASDFPTTPGLPAGKVSVLNSFITSGAFVTKLDPAARKILYSALIVGTRLGCGACPPEREITSGAAIAVDPAGEALIAGNTNTIGLPITAGQLAG